MISLCLRKQLKRKKLITFFTRFPIACLVFFSVSAFGQAPPDTYVPKFPKAKTTETVVTDLDIARPVQQFDALPDGSKWFIVDKFGTMQSLIYTGKRIDREFNDITPISFSPNGNYLIWMGLERSYTTQGFDSTVTVIHRDFDSIGNYVSDFNTLYFSHSGNHWGAILPYANILQKGDRDYVVVDGKLVSQNLPKPSQLAFGHDETKWAYRSLDGKEEKLITADGVTTVMVHRDPNNPSEPVVWYFSPDVSYKGALLDARDYPLDFTNVAELHKTTYNPKAWDTVQSWVRFHNENQGLYRWISNILIDSTGSHITYLASDPGQRALPQAQRDERKSVVVYDGKTFAGPFAATGRLFMSPSGKHLAYSAKQKNVHVYLDKKDLGEVMQVSGGTWSPDEKHFAFASLLPHDRIMVVLDGKRSGEFEQIGHIGWTKDGKAVEFLGIRNGKLIKVTETL